MIRRAARGGPLRLAALFACTAACGSTAPGQAPPPRSAQSGPPSPLAAEAVAGVHDPALRSVIADHWEAQMRSDPVGATALGDHRFDDRLARRDAAAIAADDAARDALLARLVAIDAARLDDADRTTLALLRDSLETDRALTVCRFHEWRDYAAFDALTAITSSHPVTSPRDAANLVARMRQGAQLVDDTIANLALGRAHGRIASAGRLRRGIERLDVELARPIDGWAMLAAPWASAPAPDPWPAGERERQVQALRRIVATQIKPALERLRGFLHDRLLPIAREETEGLLGLPDGEACYLAEIRASVDLPLSPSQLHALGLEEIARTDRAIAALGQTALGTPDLASTLDRLRSDPSLYFRSREELLAAAQHALDRARSAIPGYFSVVPRSDCVIRELPSSGRFAVPGYYDPPNYDGSKPGEFVVNTDHPERWPRYQLEALTSHEAIPGHHLQVAVAQQLGALPMFRRLEGSVAFVEGWALYAESLADEMGLYSSDVDRLGKLSFEAWRAARLVVDTGIHALGWTRQRAEVYLADHTALARTTLVNEVDRYIAGGGQALAYKVGQLEISKLRREAELALGSSFDLERFHDVVLGGGAVTLPVLDDRVRAWIAAQR